MIGFWIFLYDQTYCILFFVDCKVCEALRTQGVMRIAAVNGHVTTLRSQVNKKQPVSC